MGIYSLHFLMFFFHGNYGFFYNAMGGRSWQDLTMESKWTNKQNFLLSFVLINIPLCIYYIQYGHLVFLRLNFFHYIQIIESRGAEMIWYFPFYWNSKYHSILAMAIPLELAFAMLMKFIMLNFIMLWCWWNSSWQSWCWWNSSWQVLMKYAYEIQSQLKSI